MCEGQQVGWSRQLRRFIGMTGFSKVYEPHPRFVTWRQSKYIGFLSDKNWGARNYRTISEDERIKSGKKRIGKRQLYHDHHRRTIR